jgi:DNA-binding CsgD family transcriptional regulator
VGVLASSPAQLEFAKAQIDVGIVLHRDGRTADAKSSLVHGLDLAHRCGAVPMADRAESALRSTGARPRRSRLSGPESLTPSELKVARLAAEGHSNRGVAQELFVTVKTVEVHLSSVYRKLGVSRRDQLAALLARSLRA